VIRPSGKDLEGYLYRRPGAGGEKIGIVKVKVAGALEKPHIYLSITKTWLGVEGERA